MSFDSIENWLNEIRRNTTPNIKLILIGNKSDLNNKKIITKENAKIYCEENDLIII